MDMKSMWNGKKGCREAEKSNESYGSKENSEDRIQKIEEKQTVKNDSKISPSERREAKDQKKELQKQQRIFQQLEEKISKQNEIKSQLEIALANPATYSDKNKFLQTENDYKKVSGELTRLNTEYEKVFEKIIGLESGD